MITTTTHAPDFTKIMRRAVGLAVAAVTAAALLLGLLAGALGEGAAPTSAPAAVPSSAPAVPALPSAPSVASVPSVEAATTPRTRWRRATPSPGSPEHGRSVDLLAADNGLDDPDRMATGQVLMAATPPSDCRRDRGRDARRLRQHHATTVNRLLELNPQIADPDRILAGAGLQIAR